MSKTIGEIQIKLGLDNKPFERALDGSVKKADAAGGRISRALGKVKDSTGGLKRAWGGMDRVLVTPLKKAAGVAGNLAKSLGGLVAKAGLGASAIGGAVGSLVVGAGFKRATQIEDATFKLKGLGHSAEGVQSIMDNALASVKGTAFGLDEAATVAASAVAAGIKPGEQLKKTLGAVADTAAISGRGMKDIGAIFNKVAANGRLTAEEMNQLTDAGVPVVSMLSDHLGIALEDVRDKLRRGEISFSDFQEAMVKGMGGAAKTMGGTLKGSAANLKASLSRMGADFWTPITDGLTPMVGKITKAFDEINSGSKEGLDKWQKEIKKDLPKITEKIAKAVADFAPKIGKILIALFPVLMAGIQGLFDGLIKAMPELMKTFREFLPMLKEAIKNLITSLMTLLPDIIIILIELWTTVIVAICDWLANPDNCELVKDAATKVLNALVDALPVIIDALNAALPTVLTALVDWLTKPETIEKVLEAGVQLLWGLVKAIPAVGEGLIKGLMALVDNLIKFLESAAGWIGNMALGLVRGILNGVVGAFETFLNILPTGINAITMGINDAFGTNIGFIPHFSLPRFAEGGVVTSATPAIIGEAGAEVVLPLERNKRNWSGVLAETLSAELNSEPVTKTVTVNQKIEISNEMDAADIGRKLARSIRRAAI